MYYFLNTFYKSTERNDAMGGLTQKLTEIHNMTNSHIVCRCTQQETVTLRGS